MREIFTAKTPNLSFLRWAVPLTDFKYPFITTMDGSFDWLANEFIMKFSGGIDTYGITPVTSTIESKARSLRIFLNYIDENKLLLVDIEDHTIYKYVKFLTSERTIDNRTLKSHVRCALHYLIFIQEQNQALQLITSEVRPKGKFQIHVEFKKYLTRTFSQEYIDHSAIKHLHTYSADVAMVSDEQFFYWLDSIYDTKEHPTPSIELVLRWEAISYLLEATGSRITELNDISRESLKNIYDPLGDANEYKILEKVPIKKGKYKGEFRSISIQNGTLHKIILYIQHIEIKWPDLEHDKLFIDSRYGKPLTASYLKNYTKFVINKSQYSTKLKNISNHSFRHRFITLQIAKNLKKYDKTGTMTNMLTVAMTAVRKLTMHSSNDTLSTYVHLASQYNANENYIPQGLNTPHHVALTRIRDLTHSYKQNNIDSEQFAIMVTKTIDDNFT
ncbi:MAG: site-specific integrase [Endozoicomonadaceae bacterium]|nr:site-specific integrase [Endozoicomonadaceae bacterium]